MTRLRGDRTAVIYGAGGAMGCRCWPFTREGAQAFLTGRRLAPLERVATEIKRAGGAARIAQVDTLDEAATEGISTRWLRSSAASCHLRYRSRNQRRFD